MNFAHDLPVGSALDSSSLRAMKSSGDSASISSLSQLWAKKYVQRLAEADYALAELAENSERKAIAQRLIAEMRSTSVQAWAKTETLLSQEILRHEIDPQLINPWEISKDAHTIYEITLNAYAEQTTPQRLSVVIANLLGKIRQKYTETDPRVLGFISMQFHYSGQLLLDVLPRSHRPILSGYFKVIDDHLYMPLHRAYEAAASHTLDSPILKTVQHLLPHSSNIARTVVSKVLQLYPSYSCSTGLLSEPTVQISSVRDVEMFQVYLWVCALEGNVESLKTELFPLCVMLYPVLNVQWELVRQLIHLVRNEMRSHLEPSASDAFIPYYQTLWLMFSPEVFA
jgi:hypothetical protein